LHDINGGVTRIAIWIARFCKVDKLNFQSGIQNHLTLCKRFIDECDNSDALFTQAADFDRPT